MVSNLPITVPSAVSAVITLLAIVISDGPELYFSMMPEICDPERDWL